ncbi:hypothetical protein OROHE_023355 [Orobanche hederae]
MLGGGETRHNEIPSQKWKINERSKSLLRLAKQEEESANELKEFRPISLVGGSYKILSKKRLSEVLENLISKEQSAFVKGR